MPITPIEIVSMAPKSQEVTHFKQQAHNKTINEQALISNQFKNEVTHNNMKTVKTAKGENNEYRYDAKNKGNTSYAGSKHNKKKSKQDTKDTLGSHTGSIDIRI